MNKIFLIAGFTLLILLTSGCINNSEINEFAVDQIKNGNGNNGDQPPASDNDLLDIINPPNPIVIEPDSSKLSPPYICDKAIVQETLEPLFKSGMRVSRLIKFGGAIDFGKCNLIINNQPIIQFELRKEENFENAFEFMRDQENQYLAQVKDFERVVESITPNSLSFTSQSTGENRIIYIDEDPTEPVVVKVKSFPGNSASVESVREVAVVLEGLLR